jgi:translin
MRNLDEAVAKIEIELDEKDQIREIALKSSRAIIRLAGGALKGVHRDEDVGAHLSELKDEVSRLSSLLAEHPDLAHSGYVESAFQEFAEVCITMNIIKEDDVPLPEEVGVGSVPYLLALGDTVGELRRLSLEALRRGDTVKANHFLDRMEDLYHALIRFNYPDAVVAIRHKQDVARSLLEKTRGDVAVASSAKRLHDRLDKYMEE